jgi:hypothetical protein
MNENCMYEETNIILDLASVVCCLIQNCAFPFAVMYWTMMVSVFFCMAAKLKCRGKHGLRAFDNRALQKIFGLKQEDGGGGGWGELPNGFNDYVFPQSGCSNTGG